MYNLREFVSTNVIMVRVHPTVGAVLYQSISGNELPKCTERQGYGRTVGSYKNNVFGTCGWVNDFRISCKFDFQFLIDLKAEHAFLSTCSEI